MFLSSPCSWSTYARPGCKVEKKITPRVGPVNLVGLHTESKSICPQRWRRHERLSFWNPFQCPNQRLIELPIGSLPGSWVLASMTWWCTSRPNSNCSTENGLTTPWNVQTGWGRIWRHRWFCKNRTKSEFTEAHYSQAKCRWETEQANEIPFSQSKMPREIKKAVGVIRRFCNRKGWKRRKI